MEKNINYLYLKIRKFEPKAKNALAANTLYRLLDFRLNKILALSVS